MQGVNRTVVSMVVSMLAVTALVQACESPSSPAPPSPPSSASAAPGPPPASAGATSGPYTTLEAAEAFVRTQPAYSSDPPDFLDSTQTWRPTATLHAVHATPHTGMASGDWYYFFVNGNVVGQQFFTNGRTNAPVDDATLSITFTAYRSSDRHCCPTGGFQVVRYRWTGASLATLDPLTGASQ
jgi:hypothetical protein